MHIFELSHAGPLVEMNSLIGCIGNVFASFNKTFYMCVEDQFICITRKDVDLGPNTMVSNAPEFIDWQAEGVIVGGRVEVKQTKIELDNLVFDFNNIAVWKPWEPIKLASLEIINKNLHDIKDTEVECSCLLEMRIVSEEPLKRISDWLSKALLTTNSTLQTPPNSIEKLVGLGPGLTPSGDDFLGGIMVALNSIRRGDVALKLWSSISEKSKTLTGCISYSQMSAASNGYCCALFHQLINSLISRRYIFSASDVERINNIGKTSGWDFFEGVKLVLEVWVASKKMKVVKL